MAHWKKYEDEFNPKRCYDLLEHFNLLTGEQAIERFEFISTSYIDDGLMLDEETLQVMSEKDVKIIEGRPKSIFYDDIGVITVSHEYYTSAYLIGETIDDCLLLGDSLYGNYIMKIISHYLETGEYGFHVS